MNPEVHVEDVGTELVDSLKNEAGVAINCAAATLKKIVIKRPDGTIIGPFDASFDTDGIDGKLKYIGIATTFTIGQVYKYQFYVVIGTVKVYGHIQQLTVEPNIMEIE